MSQETDFQRHDTLAKKATLKVRPRWLKILLGLFVLGVIGLLASIAFVLLLMAYFKTQIPDVQELADYQPSLVTKIYSKDLEILAEYAKERRIWVSIDEIPHALIEAYLAAEDTNFYTHKGYNPKAILRAAVTNVLTGRKRGASTITQQVAKTYLLSSERTYTRKIKELLLSQNIEKAFTKDQILELYLNRIYLGHGAYGVGAAAQTYFSKRLPELTLGERALIAGLPKAPSRYNPINNPHRAKLRRDIILRRMQTEEFITKEIADAEVKSPLTLKPSLLKRGQEAPHFAEYIRRQALKEFGEVALYEDGLTIYSTLDLRLQKLAVEAVNKGVIKYDKRHGYRGPLGRMSVLINWEDRLKTEAKKARHLKPFGQFAIILELSKNSASIGLNGGEKGTLSLAKSSWAKPYIDVNTQGEKLTNFAQILKKGDIILVTPVKGTTKIYALSQYPNVQSALVAIDVTTGAIRALVGGTDSGIGFNRAIQSKRQVGSAFKPIVYAAALEKGYTPASIILDAPIVFRSGGHSWKPQNYSTRVYGPSTMRRGLERSRNLMTIRLAKDVRVPAIKNMATRLGLNMENTPNTDLTIALGTTTFSPLDITNAFATFPREGKTLPPYTITRVQDSTGTTLKTVTPRCDVCLKGWNASPFVPPPTLDIPSEQVISPENAYQMVSMLQGVIQRGTAAKYSWLGKAVAGKTGTTDSAKDGWFVGFTPTLAVGVWIGFDQPKSMGKWESGGKLTLPIWSDFVKNAQALTPQRQFKVPANISLVRIDAESGKLPGPTTKRTLLEAFIPGTAPTERTPAPSGGLTPSGAGDIPAFGIY